MKRFSVWILSLYVTRRKRINAPRQIALSFAAVILAGALLLMCPVSSKSGEFTPFLDALFTAASATCVTGLVVFDTGAYFSFFGQLVILTLIQIGGLGFMTILVIAVMGRRNRMNIRKRMIMSESLSIGEISNASSAAGRVMKLTVGAEVTGAIVLMCRFIPCYGFKGIWYGIFHSVSAFCNAGFDVFGTNSSLINHNNDPIVITTVSLLIITGGIGFLVFEDIYRKKSFKKLNLYSKLVLTVTAVLLLAGTLLFFILERRNPSTIGEFETWRKCLNAFFQSVTCRTAGFDSVGQGALKEHSKLVSVLLMMIGGASGSTAGGIKVGTIGVIMLAVISALKSRENVVVWGRRISSQAVNRAMMLLVMWFILVMGAAVFVSLHDSFPLIDALYEVTSAYGTAGLSVGVTGASSAPVRVLLIIYMFLGRVGIMTISVIFITKAGAKEKIGYPEGKVIIG